ncbi:sigma-54-dependent transcriptional regulator [Paenibacillus amylolyticus]|uniref:Fis family sigma-54 specific transcriptional regulator n=1 Tax=Paenibacillus amylolyticus TaxID=1451 RepID=A0A100VSU1_PAEAM|nr:sigma-54-dependent transcriptional regulator [Paenibacillus amylolyticus]GAS85375.1 Fis family sigma-54 specific transcriptional regulator [Paenibacillus amylolyticus]
MRTRVHFIAPYESMIPIIQECIPRFPQLTIQTDVGDLANGVELATQAEKNGAEIIISRGGTAQLIKKAVTIPVIDVQLSGYDMIRSLTLASQFNGQTAIVGFSNITSGAQSIIDLMDLPLKVYTIHSSEDVARLLLELKASGYRQIVGDVITVNTAKTYGLEGLLIQSGQESILRAMEDAQLVYRYLSKNHTISIILNDLVTQEHPNLLILNERNEVVFENLTDFEKNPLTDNHMYLTNTSLDFHQSHIQNVFMVNDYQLTVNAYETNLDNKSYKVYMLEKGQPYAFAQFGITTFTDASMEPIVAESPAMQAVLNNIRALYEHHEPIYLLGEADSGKSFLVKHIHQMYSGGGLLLQIDLTQVPPGHLHKIPLAKVRNVEINRMEARMEDEELLSFIQSCLQSQIGVFILGEQTLNPQWSLDLKLNTIIMPNLADRPEDLAPLMQHFLTGYYQKYGTTAVRIKEDALQLIRDQITHMNVNQLKHLIKQAALNEQEYVITTATLSRLLDQQPVSSQMKLSGTLKDIEKEVIQFVLQEENNNQSKAAERLGINRATLWRKLKD